MSGIPIAVQLYTLRKECEEDFAGTLRQVAELGFDGVELAGFGGLSVEEVKELLDDLNLKAASCHVPLETLKKDTEQVIRDMKVLESSYVVCPYITERAEEDYHQLIKDLKEIGQACNGEGITLCYHNHDFELEKLSDGRTALETIFSETDPATLQTEFDIYWLKKADEDPLEWLTRYKGRTPLVHLKDMTRDEEKFFAELGTGGVDVDAVLERGNQLGVKWWIVEQDETRKTPIESLEISLHYLKNRI